jgi:hypothetical protein
MRAMSLGARLHRQWEGYARYHQDRANLLIHIVAVPLFLAASTGLVAAIALASLPLLGAAIGGMVAAVALQGRGHRLEPVPPQPFSGQLDFVLRLFLEQWITFPRFVLSGGWSAALRKTRER